MISDFASLNRQCDYYLGLQSDQGLTFFSLLICLHLTPFLAPPHFTLELPDLTPGPFRRQCDHLSLFRYGAPQILVVFRLRTLPYITTSSFSLCNTTFRQPICNYHFVSHEYSTSTNRLSNTRQERCSREYAISLPSLAALQLLPCPCWCGQSILVCCRN